MEKESGSVPNRKRGIDDFCGSPRAVFEVDPLEMATPEKKIVHYNRKSKKKKDQSVPLIENASFSGGERVVALDKITEIDSLTGSEDIVALDKIPESHSLSESGVMDALSLLCGDVNLPDLLKDPSFVARVNTMLGTSLSIDTTSSLAEQTVNISHNERKVQDSSKISCALPTSITSTNVVVPEATVYSISQITPNTPMPWKVGVRVIEKGFPRVGRNSANPITYLRCIFMDDEGSRVQATIFGEDIDAMGNKLNLFNRCFVSNAIVQPILNEHRVVQNEFQWHLQAKVTSIEDISTESADYICNPYNLVSFNNFDDYLNLPSTIDVLAAVMGIFPAKKINTRTGSYNVQEVLLVDQTC